MAVTYGFYDSLNHDRLYNAQQMSAIFDGIINDGVFMSVGNQFHTVAGTGMQVIVKSGRAWFDSTWTLNDAEYPLSIDAADVLLTRIDAVVLEVNSEVATRANTIKVVKGTPASTPAKPTLTNTATIHQHALAYVTVAKNTTAITNSMIEIVVGKTETPYVTAILQTTDITDLYNQWEDYFQTWFDTVRGTLDGDVALNLQNQITTLRRETLKNTTPPIIGLPSSATPDDMFQALAKTGELHVWRKTITSGTGTYSLGAVQEGLHYIKWANNSATSDSSGTFEYGSEIAVNNDGTITGIKNPSTITIKPWDDAASKANVFKGKFIKMISQVETSMSHFKIGEIWWIPSDAVMTKDLLNGESGRWYIAASKRQEVVGVPAGTTTTYPVSTNPNAYQEGEYGKAGYTLGDVKTGTFQIGQDATTIAANRAIIKYGASVSVTDTGTASIVSESELTVTSDSSQSAVDKLKGKFFRFSQLPFSSSAFSVGTIYFFPANTVFTKQSSGNWYASKYQTVTSHGKTEPEYTIEYLGKLGNKSNMQLVSYIGTGTSGKNNPCSVTASFKIKLAIMLGYVENKGFITLISSNNYSIIVADQLSTNYKAYRGFMYNGSSNTSGSSSFGKISGDNKTIYWYFDGNALYQCNSASNKYYILLLG